MCDIGKVQGVWLLEPLEDTTTVEIFEDLPVEEKTPQEEVEPLAA